MEFAITTRDAIWLVVLASGVFFILTLAELLRRKEIIDGKTSRKIVHISVGNIVFFIPFCFSNLFAAVLGPLFFVLFTWLTCPASPIKKLRLKAVEEGHAFGTVYYALSFTILVLIFFRPSPSSQYNLILLGSFLPLVWGDGLSAVVGKRYNHYKPDIWLFREKSLIGTWVAAYASFISVFIGFLVYRLPFAVSLYLALLIGFVTAIVELLTPYGLDNLTIPFFNSLVLYGIFVHSSHDFNSLNPSLSVVSIISSVIVGVILAVAGLLSHALTIDGALSGMYFGIIILGIGSWVQGSMYGVFFILGSLASFVGLKNKRSVTKEFEKGDTARDSLQAIVNSIVPAVAILLRLIYPLPVLDFFAAGALATSLADTLGTEIGVLSKSQPRLAYKPWKRVERGTPGAISLLGMFGSILGGLLIAITGYVLSFIDPLTHITEGGIFIISTTIGGMIGAYFDSVFGGTIQIRNRCVVCNKIVEKKVHCGKKTVYVKGIKWLANDLVNLFSIIVGAGISVVIYRIALL